MGVPKQFKQGRHKQSSAGVKFSSVVFSHKVKLKACRIMSQETVLSDYEGKYQDKFLASTEFGKEASGTIGDYLTGTITLVFGIFFLSLLLTTYARYKGRKENPSSFANPPPRAYRPQLQEPLSNAPPATSGQSTLL